MMASTRSAGRKESSRRSVVSVLPEMVPLEEMVVTNSTSSSSSMSWVIGPSRTMARRSVLDLDLVEFVEDGPAEVGTEREQQHGGLLVAAQVALVGVAADDQLLWR